MEKIRSALRRLDLSQSEQDVYLSLLRDGQATARLLATRTGITRPSVYDQLKSLRALGLVVELDSDGKTHFAAADIHYLDTLLEDKIDRIEQSRDFLKEALPSLLEQINTVQPKVRFFEGEEAVKQMLKDLMWHDHETVYVLWPHESLSDILDEKFLGWFDDRRQKRHLTIHSLWPQSTKSTTPPIFKSANDKRRHLPKTAHVEMGYLIYKDKVAFISSAAEAFGFIVDSREFATLQKLQFQTLWSVSK